MLTLIFRIVYTLGAIAKKEKINFLREVLMKKILFFFTLFLLSITIVNAAKEGLLVRERINDTYTYYYDENLGRDRYLYAQRAFLRSEIVYCLELGKEINTTVYTYTNSFDELNLDDEVLNNIKLLSYYGYNYPGHNTENYYMATQELIWNELTDTKISWVLEMNPSKVVDISKEKDDILNLLNTHYQKPSFDNSEIDFVPGKELVLEDTNNVLRRFVPSDENVAIEDNKLIIKPNFDKESIVLNKPSYLQTPFLLYTAGTSQKMMAPGKPEPVTSTIKVNIVGGTFELTKLDKETGETPQGQATLKGAIYELYDSSNNIVGTITTGTKNKIEELAPGTYTLKEKTPSKGYLLDNTIYNIEITKDNLDVKLNVYEEVIKRKVEIFKVFASNTTGILTPEANISFEIYNKDNKLIDTITTDTEGYASVILPYGTYRVKQLNTTKDHYKVEDFTITIDQYNDKPIYKLLSDSEITAKIRIIKKDFDTKENILNSSIKFKIFDVKNNKYILQKVSYPENRETTEFQVDKNGIFITPVPLSPGEYILEEVKKSMNGYLHNSEKITFTVGESSNFIKEDEDVFLEISFYNKRVKGAINIIKYGEEIVYKDDSYFYKEIPLEKVVFNLYAKEDIYENGNLIYKESELVKELITDKEGKITIGDLPLGKYYLKEISTTNNHLLNDIQYDIELKYKDEETKVVTENIKIKNYLPKGNLTITKYESGTTLPIPNTLIEVHNKDNIVIYKGYTDSDGQITLKDLPYGEYYLSELEASTGYRLLEDTIPLEINEEEKILEIYNERIKVPNTGLTFNMTDILIIICIIVGILLIIIYPKQAPIVLISVLIILLGVTYLIINIYNYYNDTKSNQNSVEAYLTKEISPVTEEKYNYTSVLEVPAVNIKRGVLDINNEYNDAKYNIELLKEDDSTIVLAAHNGDNLNSYFGKLHNMVLGDYINYYKDGVLYKYIYSENYDIKKNGYADIYRKKDKKSIILITCKDNTDDAQTVYIGYLIEESAY